MSGQPGTWIEHNVAVGKTPMDCNLIKSERVESELSKKTWYFWFIGISSMNQRTDCSAPHCSAPALCFRPYLKHDPRLTCSRIILETPLMGFFQVLLFYPSTTLCFGRYDLFIYRMTLLCLNLYAGIFNQSKQCSHLEKFVVWVLSIISGIIITYVEKLSQCFTSFHCHSHGNSFISKFGRPARFVLGHFDNSHSNLDTKEHLKFFSIRFYWLSTLLNVV